MTIHDWRWDDVWKRVGVCSSPLRRCRNFNSFFINRITIGSQIGCPRLLERWSEAYVRLFQFCRVDWRISTNLCVDDNKVFLWCSFQFQLQVKFRQLGGFAAVEEATVRVKDRGVQSLNWDQVKESITIHITNCAYGKRQKTFRNYFYGSGWTRVTQQKRRYRQRMSCTAI